MQERDGAAGVEREGGVRQGVTARRGPLMLLVLHVAQVLEPGRVQVGWVGWSDSRKEGGQRDKSVLL